MRLAGTFAVLALAAVAAGCGDTSTLADAGGGPSRTTASALTVIISGPNQVNFNDLGCEWPSLVYGGVAPYAYDWTDSRTTVHTTGTTYSRPFSDSVTITLVVTDALGQQVTATKAVSVYSPAPGCYT